MLESRIIEVFNYSKLTRIEFANKVGISNAVMSHISSGRNKASTDLIITILRNFDDISPDWLLFGNGEMLRSKGHAHLKHKEDMLHRINEIKNKREELESLLNEFQYFIENFN